MRPHFTGKPGFVLVPRRPRHWWSRPTFDFHLDAVEPLTFCGMGIRAQPDQHFVTDGGSIPHIIQLLPAFDSMRYPKAYAFHDSAYRHHAWYTARPHEINFHKEPLTREQADGWLRTMLIAEGATQATARTVYRAVRAFGGWCW